MAQPQQPVSRSLIVRPGDDVELLRQPARAPRRTIALLQIPGLPREKSLEWQLKLNALLRECGCSLGAKFVLLAVVGSIIWQSLRLEWELASWPRFLLLILAAMFIAGCLGKAIGIGVARTRIKRIARQTSISPRVRLVKELIMSTCTK